MQTARDVLQPALVVSPGVEIEPLARLFLTSAADGACVIEEGRLVGVVTVMDLLFKQRQGRRVAGGCARDIMNTPPITVAPSASLDQIATLMVERHLTMVPVVEHDGVVGVVTKQGLLAASGLAGDEVEGLHDLGDRKQD